MSISSATPKKIMVSGSGSLWSVLARTGTPFADRLREVESSVLLRAMFLLTIVLPASAVIGPAICWAYRRTRK